jgi:hypothetical protein
MWEEPTEIIDRSTLGELVSVSAEPPTKLISRSELAPLLAAAVPPQVQIRFVRRPEKLHQPDGSGTAAERTYSRFAAIAVSCAITLGAGLMIAMIAG